MFVLLLLPPHILIPIPNNYHCFFHLGLPGMGSNIGSGSRLRVFKESPGLRAGPRASVPYMGGCQN